MQMRLCLTSSEVGLQMGLYDWGISHFVGKVAFFAEIHASYIDFTFDFIILHSKLKNCVERPCVVKGWL